MDANAGGSTESTAHAVVWERTSTREVCNKSGTWEAAATKGTHHCPQFQRVCEDVLGLWVSVRLRGVRVRKEA